MQCEAVGKHVFKKCYIVYVITSSIIFVVHSSIWKLSFLINNEYVQGSLNPKMITSVGLSFPHCNVTPNHILFAINQKDNRGTVWNVCCGALQAADPAAASCPYDKNIHRL